MAEILTESFCERCGSRYTFESAVPRARLRGVKVLSRGLKNFVLDDKTSIDEAMAAARDDTDRSLTSQQLEAFHKTFNFCMQCRQYICPNCWNEGEGRCLTCAPTLGRGILPAPFPHLDPSAGVLAAPDDGLAAAAMNGHTHVGGETNGNGFDSVGHLETLTQASAPSAPVEMIGGEVEARATVEPDAIAPASDEPGSDAVDAEAAALASLHATVAEPEAERFIYDPYDPPPPAPPAALVADPVVAEPVVAEVGAPAPEPEVVVEASQVLETPTLEPEVAAEAAVAESVAVDETVAAQDVVAEAGAETASDDAEAGSDRAAAPAAETSLLLAGLRPGQSLDEALAAFEAEPVADEAAEAVVAEAVVASDEPAAPEPIEHAVADAAVIAALASTDRPRPRSQLMTPSRTHRTRRSWPPLPRSWPGARRPLPPRRPRSPARRGAGRGQPEPVAFVEPLDEILLGGSAASEPVVDVQPGNRAGARLAGRAARRHVAAAEVIEAQSEPAVEAAPEPTAPEPEIEIAAVEAAPEPTAPEPEIEIAAVEAAPEPTAPEPEIEIAAVEAAPEPTATQPGIAAAAADDIVAQPTWSILAPDPQPVSEVPGPLADGPASTIAPLAPAAQAAPPASDEPSWPAQPQWPAAQVSSGLPFLGRHAVPTGGVEALWAESTQAVTAPRTDADKPTGGVQPCTSCGLSLSASARFCRRCGTSQVG